MEIDEVAARLDAVAVRLSRPSGRVQLVDPGPTAFGADAVGQLGALGRALAGQCDEALAARDREAARAATSAAELANALRDSVAGHQETEAVVRGRVGGV